MIAPKYRHIITIEIGVPGDEKPEPLLSFTEIWKEIQRNLLWVKGQARVEKIRHGLWAIRETQKDEG